MQSWHHPAAVPLDDTEETVPSGSIWLGPVDADHTVSCTIRLRPGRHQKLSPTAPFRTGGACRGDRDSQEECADPPDADPKDIERVRQFLDHARLDVVRIDARRRTVAISGSAASIAEAFRVQLARYKHAGNVHLGHIAPIRVPSAIADIVDGIGDFEDLDDPFPPGPVSRNPWRIVRRPSVTVLLALSLGAAIAVSLSGRPGPADLAPSTSTALPALRTPPAVPPQRPAPAQPPELLGALQDMENAGWQALQAGRAQDAQDYFLRVLVTDPNRPKAMKGLVAARRKMAGDDSQLIRKQMVQYQEAVTQGKASRLSYTVPALELLVSASERALRQIEAEGERAAVSALPAMPGTSPNRLGQTPPPPSSQTQAPATRQPPHAAISSGKAAQSPQPPRSRTRPPGASSQTQAVTPPAGLQPSTQGTGGLAQPPAGTRQAPVSPAPPVAPTQPPATPAPQRSPVTLPPAASGPPVAPPSPSPQATPAAPAPQATAPASTQLYMVRIGPISADRTATIANRLVVRGFSDARLGSQTGYRVVSEPLPRGDAQRLVTALTARGFHCYMAPMAGDTVQVVFGAFASQQEAESFSGRIAAVGFDAWVRPATVYILRLGPYPSSSVGAITDIVKDGDPQASVTADPVP
jgi:hypothetical protein